ncbi:RNA polymerase sigma factor [Pigmentiphaga aceris]|uniref:RNA polymerase sigma factor n=1 Tax=Pigmentiphaga aceris TaxID=1940612 RepID=UPI0016528FBF|nr:RNA polymerase sigma factor [Pigmentiphaga aceris]
MSDSPPEALLSTLIRHYDDLVDHVRRRFGDRHLARDVVQDVCVRLIETPPRKPIREPLAFLRHVSTHLAIDRCRVADYRVDRTALMAAGPHASETPATPDETAIAEQARAALLAAIQALPERCREVFILHALYEVPQTEIAKRLGISRTMVARHLARADEALQPLLSRSNSRP